MKSYNKTVISGNIGKDPEIRSMPNGDQVASFSVAVNDGYKKDGEWVDKTHWINVAVFNPHLVKLTENYLTKGSRVLVEGKLSTRSWDDKNGEKKYATEVVLEKFGGEIHLLDKKEASDKPVYDRTPSYGAGTVTRRPVDEMEDDIPFAAIHDGAIC